MVSAAGFSVRNFMSLYRSPNIVKVNKARRLRWAGHISRMEEGRSTFKFFTDIPIRNKPLGKPRPRWEDIVRINLKKMGINRKS